MRHEQGHFIERPNPMHRPESDVDSTNRAPSADERDRLFKAFGRAWFKRDVALLYDVVAPEFVWSYSDGTGRRLRLSSRSEVAAEFIRMAERPTRLRFEDVVYHHAPDATFMTFRAIETDPATGAVVGEDVGVERYTFQNGRIALKDVYRKPAG